MLIAREHTDLPAVRSSERARYKRCQKAWYWAWRKGYVPRAHRFGALELGTWAHTALAQWYTSLRNPNARKIPTLLHHFRETSTLDIVEAERAKAPQYILDKAWELQALGEEMMKAYQNQYGRDEKLKIIGVEVPLSFLIPDPETDEIIAVHKFKPDAIFADEHDDLWLMEHKTATSIQTGHLTIDDQARPYGAMSEHTLRKAGILVGARKFKGIMYNFLRKALPDSRPTNEKGQYLNQNGSVSKTQPPPLFLRKNITMTKQEKIITLRRVQAETVEITLKTQALRSGAMHPNWLNKTPHKSCPKICEFFDMCEAEERGIDITGMQKTMFFRRNPYLYEEEN